VASTEHEALVMLFRNRPLLAPELIRQALGVGLPAFTEARIESAELAEVVPTSYRADLVVLLLESRPVCAIVVEVQLRRDEAKRLTWPLYLASLRARLDCPTSLLVVTPSAAVARWSGRPIELGHPGFVLTPLVVGPSAVPVVTDARQAREAPELAVLSAMAHGKKPVGLSIAQVAIHAAEAAGLDEEAVGLYADLVLTHLAAAARSAMESLMQSGYQYQSAFAKRYFGAGRQEGRQEGREEGLQEGLTASLLRVLETRGIKLGAKARSLIEGSRDPKQLELWLTRAVSAESADALFDPPKRRRTPSKSKPRRR